MENGSELLRLLAQLQDRPPSADQCLTIRLLAIGVRELATGTMLMNAALADVVAENNLSLTPQLLEELRKIHNVSKALRDGADEIARQYEPPEARGE